MNYLDASLVVATLVREPHSEAVLDWVTPHNTALYASAWVTAEVASALSLKVRSGQISDDLRTTATGAWRQSIEDSIKILAIIEDDFAAAAMFCGDPSLNLRAPDALHLAIAKRADARLVTLDVRLFQAAITLGIACVNPVKDSQ